MPQASFCGLNESVLNGIAKQAIAADGIGRQLEDVAAAAVIEGIQDDHQAILAFGEIALPHHPGDNPVRFAVGEFRADVERVLAVDDVETRLFRRRIEFVGADFVEIADHRGPLPEWFVESPIELRSFVGAYRRDALVGRVGRLPGRCPCDKHDADYCTERDVTQWFLPVRQASVPSKHDRMLLLSFAGDGQEYLLARSAHRCLAGQILRVATAGGTAAARRDGSMTARVESTHSIPMPAGRKRQSRRGNWNDASSQ